jgi:hypothetical protein
VTGFWLNHVRKPYTCITPHLRTISINQANQHRSRASSRRRYDPGLVLWQWMENHSAASGTDPVSLEHFRRPHGPGNQHQDHARTSESLVNTGQNVPPASYLQQQFSTRHPRARVDAPS